MKNYKYALLLIILVLCYNGWSQVTWSDDVAEIVYNKCSKCHHDQGVANFSLLSYSDFYSAANGIGPSVTNDRMPPWPPEKGYQHYSDERFLTADEKNKIIDFINQGMPIGNVANEPAPPVFTGSRIIQLEPDLTIEMPPYASAASSADDDYVMFALPHNLTQGVKLKAFEVVPGNTEILHHCLVYKVPAGSYPPVSTNSPGPNGAGVELIGGYAPGAIPIIFPSSQDFSAGFSLGPNEDIVLAMHYPAGSGGDIDSSKVNFYFYPEAEVDSSFREIIADDIIQKWFFCIPPGTKDSVQDTYGATSQDLTFMSVFPHMHQIGESIETYAVTGQNDTVPFMNIPEWDFHWQGFYFFKNFLKIPQGSTIYGKGVYNNIAGELPNYPNPNPVNVCSGLNTSDEMFIIYYHYMAYQQGDENINLDSLNLLWLQEQLFASVEENKLDISGQIISFPNPANDQITFALKDNFKGITSAIVYDFKGNKVVSLNSNSLQKELSWDLKNEQGLKVKSGQYIISMLVNGAHVHKRFLVF